MELVKWENAKFEKNSLILSENISIDEWKDLGSQLKKIEGCVQFWIGDWARFGDKKGFTGKYTDSKVYDELEEITGLDRRTIQDYKTVSDRTSTVRHADLGYSHHREVASLEPIQQTEILNRASEEKLSVRETRNIVKELKRENMVSPEIPENEFQVIYCDPPWKYNDKQDTNMLGGAEKHYPTMSIEDLCFMKIPKTSNNAILFIWVTSPLLEDVFKIINAWGFKYKSSFIWDKVGHNMGHYNSVRHELLLIATKGSMTPENVKLFDSVQSIEKTNRHSEKPNEFGEIINTLYPSANKIEMFARDKKDFHNDKWIIWGNEV